MNIQIFGTKKCNDTKNSLEVDDANGGILVTVMPIVVKTI